MTYWYSKPTVAVVGGFEVTDHNGGDLAAMMNTGVQKMDALFTAALGAGRLDRDPTLSPPAAPPPPPDAEIVDATGDAGASGPAQAIQLLVAAPDGATLSAAIEQVRGMAGVDVVTETSVAIGGTSSIVATYHGDIAALRAALIARGWSVETVGGQLKLSRAQTAPAAAAPPPVPAPTQ